MASGGVLRALLDRVRDGLLVFFVGVVLFRAAAAGYFITRVVVPAAVRVVAKAAVTAVFCLTIHAMRGGVVGQRGGADGAGCENHVCLSVVCRVGPRARVRVCVR